MINFDLFEQLEQTNSRLAKEVIIAKMNDEEQTLLEYALNPFKQYKIKKVLFEYEDTYEYGSIETTLNEFISFLDEMSVKKAAKDRDKYHAGSLIDNSPKLQRKWFERILLKDLRCGVDAKTINKVFPGLIPAFGCALADTYNPEKHSVVGKHVDVKLDGVRCIAIVKGGIVTLLSRNGKFYESFSQIEKELTIMPDGEYDGEIYLPKENGGFQELMKHVKREENAPEELPFRYYLFDVILDAPYIRRLGLLNAALVERFGNAKFGPSDPFVLKYGDSLGVLTSLKVINEKHLLETLDGVIGYGYEGLMVKDVDAKYEKKRTKNILKVKQFYSTEAIVTGAVEGKGKYKGKLGALVLVGPNDEKYEIGSGFDDMQREQYWKNQPLGRIVEVKYQELTKDGIPRFPIFLRFRDDMEAGL